MAKKSIRKNPIDHSDCECVIIPRGIHRGLYCLPHRRYIKWLSRADQDIIKTMDIAWLDHTPDWILTQRDH